MQINLSGEKKLALVVTLFLVQAPILMGISFKNGDFPYKWGNLYSLLSS